MGDTIWKNEKERKEIGQTPCFMLTIDHLDIKMWVYSLKQNSKAMVEMFVTEILLLFLEVKNDL